HQFRARGRPDGGPVRGVLAESQIGNRPVCGAAAGHGGHVRAGLRPAARGDQPGQPRQGREHSAGDAGPGHCAGKPGAGLVQVGYAQYRYALYLVHGRDRAGFHRAAQAHGVCRGAGGGGGAVVDDPPHRPGPRDTRGGPRKAGRQVDGHRCRTRVCLVVRHRHGVPGGGGMLSVAGILRQPAGGKRLCAGGLYHRGAGRHGQLCRRARRRAAGWRGRVGGRAAVGRYVGADGHLRHLYPGAAVPPAGFVRSPGLIMKDLYAVLLFGVAVAVAATMMQSGVALTFIMMTLYATLLAQAWNILGGYGGQLSFGHALFFGVGAYGQALGQLSLGLNPWLALPLAIALGAGAGLAVGGLTFRYGLRGSYFALVTLAFAEVFRILAVSVPFTGGGVGLMVPLQEGAANMQFATRHGYIYLLLAFVMLALLVTAWLRHSRFGAYLQAVRD